MDILEQIANTIRIKERMYEALLRIDGRESPRVRRVLQEWMDSTLELESRKGRNS
jgi:hypothetical protein